MNGKVQVRRRGNEITVIRVQAEANNPVTALALILQSGVTIGWPYHKIQRLAENLRPADAMGWWIVRPE